MLNNYVAFNSLVQVNHMILLIYHKLQVRQHPKVASRLLAVKINGFLPGKGSPHIPKITQMSRAQSHSITITTLSSQHRPKISRSY